MVDAFVKWAKAMKGGLVMAVCRSERLGGGGRVGRKERHGDSSTSF